MQMKICIFFDGQNFYRSLQRYDDTLRVDYDRLATWITQAGGGWAAVVGGAEDCRGGGSAGDVRRRILPPRRLARRAPGGGGLPQGARAAAWLLREARPARAAHR